MRNSDRRNAMKFVLLVGTVSLFADMTYEGARSIAGPFLLKAFADITPGGARG